MPGGELNDISLAIGRLQEAIEASREDHKKLAARVETMNDKLDILPSLVTRVEKIEPLALDWQKTKNKALGAIAVTGLGGLGVGTGIGPFLRHLAARMFQ